MAQMFDHMLNSAKGWPDLRALDFVAPAAAAVEYTLRAGQTCHQNSSGHYEPGVRLAQMPLFIFQNADDYDVLPPAGGYQWYGIIPAGNIMSIVGTCGFELETTEFVGSLTYARNDLLKAPVGLTSGYEALGADNRPTTSSSGVLRNDAVTLYTTSVVGYVSRGVVTNYNTEMLSFWPHPLPGTV